MTTEKKVTVRSRVAEYMTLHPDAKAAVVAEALGAKLTTVGVEIGRWRNAQAGGTPAAPKTRKARTPKAVTETLSPLEGLKFKAEGLREKIAEQEQLIISVDGMRAQLDKINRAIAVLEEVDVAEEDNGESEEMLELTNGASSAPEMGA